MQEQNPEQAETRYRQKRRGHSAMQDLRGIRNQETEGRLFSQAQSHLQTKEYGHGGHVN